MYPLTPHTADDLLTLSGRYLWRALRQIFLLIVIFVALKSGYTHLPVLPWWANDLLTLLITVVVIFLWLVGIYRVDALFRGVPLTWRQALQKTQQRIGIIYLVVILMITGIAAIFALGWWITFPVLRLNAAPAALVIMVITGAPSILLLVYGYLALFFLAITKQSIWQVFHRSALCMRRYFLLLIVLYTEIIVLLLVSFTHTQHSQWLLNHYLMEITDLIAASLILPLALNLTLLILHDMELYS